MQMHQPTESHVAIDPLIKRHRVEELTSLSTASIYAEMTAGRFPRPVRTGLKAVAWKTSDVANWINSREQVAA